MGKCGKGGEREPSEKTSIHRRREKTEKTFDHRRRGETFIGKDISSSEEGKDIVKNINSSEKGKCIHRKKTFHHRRGEKTFIGEKIHCRRRRGKDIGKDIQSSECLVLQTSDLRSLGTSRRASSKSLPSHLWFFL